MADTVKKPIRPEKDAAAKHRSGINAPPDKRASHRPHPLEPPPAPRR